MQINREILTAIRDEMNAALAAVGAKYGVSIHAGRGSFTASSCILKVQVAVLDESGVAETRERTAWKTHATQFGLDPAKLDAQVTFKGRQYKIVGLAAASTCYPVVAQRDDGRMFRLPASAAI